MEIAKGHDVDIFETTTFSPDIIQSDETLPDFNPPPEDTGVMPDSSWLSSTEYFSGG
jgi:hypothetical protein